MNCKPGDLAITVCGVLPGNIGMLLKVDAPYRGYAFPNHEGPAWMCTALSHGPTSNHGTPIVPGESIHCCDAWLKPIRDPGEDAQDETLQWLPAPTKELA